MAKADWDKSRLPSAAPATPAQKVARKGDTRQFDGQEMESIGEISIDDASVPEADRVTDEDYPSWEKGTSTGKNPNTLEMWRKKKKPAKAVPTS